MTIVEAAYFLDHYGKCALEKCACLEPGNPWLGRACSNWHPNGATTYEELIQEAARAASRREAKHDA